ncbi:MAG: sulfite exporter TauE/SafE family protein [Chloroflexi bacterium]|nr:sulfite exporter TauE/SafE family protein [Chloroflexota bacterium]
MSPLLLIVGLITGTMIGTFGVGGVLLVPFLFYGLGVDLHIATAMSSWSFLFTGIVGTITYSRSISWNIVAWLMIGIIPAAVLGARANVALSSAILIPLLAALILGSGLNTLLSRAEGERLLARLGRGSLVLLGVVTGFGSALTGTGGPVLLVPMLMFMKINALAAIAASQVVQVPIALAAAIGFGLFGEIDLVSGTMLGVIQSFGVIVGARVAHALKPEQLRRFVALALIAVAILMISRILIAK